MTKYKEPAKQIKTWQSTGDKVVFTNGCFDLLHSGHISLLNQAAQNGDRLVVGLNSDDSVRRLKGASRPVQTENDRKIILEALRVVDLVIIFDEDTPAELIAATLPDVLVKGADYAGNEIVGTDTVQNNGGMVIRVQLEAGRSTSNLIDRVRQSLQQEKP